MFRFRSIRKSTRHSPVALKVIAVCDSCRCRRTSIEGGYRLAFKGNSALRKSCEPLDPPVNRPPEPPPLIVPPDVDPPELEVVVLTVGGDVILKQTSTLLASASPTFSISMFKSTLSELSL